MTAIASLDFKDKTLPHQPPLSQYYSGSAEEFPGKLYSFLAETAGLLHPEREFKLKTTPRVSVEEMASHPVALRFLEFVVLMKRPKRVLEIGTFIGLASMHMAAHLPRGGRVVTIEKFPEFAEIAQENFTRNKLKDKIALVVGDALEKIRSGEVKGPFDLVFIDGNKENYDDYFNWADLVIPRGGVIIIDDSFFHGDVLNAEPRTEKGKGVQKCLRLVAQRRDYHKLVLPIVNGITVLIKR